MSGETETAGTNNVMQQETDFTDKYGRAIVAIFIGIVVTTVIPLLNLIRLLPFFKEVVFGALVVAGFTAISDGGDGAKYALVAGMAAAVIFNMLWIPFQFIAPSLIGAATGGAEGASAGMAAGLLGGLGALSNLIGLLILSPIGYAVGGLIGTFFN